MMFRKGKSDAADHGKPFRRRRWLFLTAAALVVISALTIIFNNLSSSPEIKKNFQRLSIKGEVLAETEKIQLVKLSDNPAAAHFAEQLAAELNTAGFPTIIGGAGSPVECDTDRSQTFLIDYYLMPADIEATGAWRLVPQSLRPSIAAALNWLPATLRGGKTVIAPILSPFTGAHTFSIQRLSLPISISATVNGLALPPQMPGTSGYAAVKNVNSVRAAEIAARESAAEIIRCLSKGEQDVIVKLPELTLGEVATELPDFSELRDCRLEMIGIGSEYNSLRIYSFERGDNNSDLNAITRALERIGFVPSPEGHGIGFDGHSAHRFVAADRARSFSDVVLVVNGLSPNKSITRNNLPPESRGRIVVCHFRHPSRRTGPDQEMLKKFRTDDPLAFLLCSGANTIPAEDVDERFQLVEQFFDDERRSFTADVAVLRSLNSVNLNEAEIARFDRELIRLIEETLKLSPHSSFARQLNGLVSLINSSKRQEQLRKLLFDRCGEVVSRHELPTATGTVGRTFEIPLRPDLPVRILDIELGDERFSMPLLIFGEIVDEPDPGARLIFSGGSNTMTSAARRNNWRHESSWNSFTSRRGRQQLFPVCTSFSEVSHGPSPTSGVTGGIVNLVVEMDEARSCLRLEVTFSPPPRS